MKAWDVQSINRKFKAAAENHRLRVKECRQRVARNSSYEQQADEALARYQAHDYFVDRTFLQTRNSLLQELGRLRDRNHTPSEVYDADTYQGAWTAEVDELIARFSGGASDTVGGS